MTHRVEIWGFGNSLVTEDAVDAKVLAETLLHNGYDVKIDGARVRIEYRPGYDEVVWDDGKDAGEPVLP